MRTILGDRMCYFLAVGLFRPFLAIQWPFGPLIRNHMLIFWWESVLSQRFSLLINCIYCAMEAFSEEEWHNLCLLFLSLLFCSFGWCMGQCLVRQQRLGGFNLKTGFEAERAQKGTLDTFSKEMDAKILFLSSHTDDKDWKMLNLAKSGVMILAL